jgi:O-antigen/teichoic acid export membrane protein
MTVFSFILLFSSMGVDKGIAREIPRENNQDRPQILSSGIFVGLAIGVSLTIGLLLLAKPLAQIPGVPQVSSLIQIFAIALPPTIIFRILMGFVRGESRALPRVLSQNIILPTIKLALFGGLVILGMTVSAFAWAHLIAILVATATLLYFIRSEIEMVYRSLPSRDLVKSLVIISIPLMFVDFMSEVLTQADTFLLSIIIAESGPVGIYRTVYPLGQQLLLILSAVSYFVLPEFSRIDSSGAEGLNSIYKDISKWVFGLTLPMAIMIFWVSGSLIKLLFGSEYIAGAITLQILLVGFLSHVAAGPNEYVLMAVGEGRIVMVVDIAVAILNILLNILLIPYAGIEGAASATAASLIIRNGTALEETRDSAPSQRGVWC